MTLYVDSSALVRRYLHDRHRPIVLEAMAGDDPWCASALARTEAQLALHRAAVSARQQAELWRALRDEWESFWVVPLDDRCMARAVEIGATYGVRIVDAVHLAAADRLPAPVRFLTFDRQQIPGADALLAQLAGLPHALVTSATRELAAIRMRAAGVRMPAVVVAAEDVTVGKPAPEGFLAGPTLRLMDWAGNRGHNVVLPYNYLTRAEWQGAFYKARLNTVSSVERLGIYPPPFTWFFDRKLHFVALLTRRDPAR